MDVNTNQGAEFVKAAIVKLSQNISQLRSKHKDEINKIIQEIEEDKIRAKINNLST